MTSRKGEVRRRSRKRFSDIRQMPEIDDIRPAPTDGIDSSFYNGKQDAAIFGTAPLTSESSCVCYVGISWN